MENSSPSATSQRSQTLFPPNAFNPWLTIGALLVAPIIVFGTALAAGIVAMAGGLTTTAGLQRFFFGLPGVQVQSIGEIGAVVFLLVVLQPVAQMRLRDLGFRSLTLADAGTIAVATVAMVLVTNGFASLLQTAMHTKVNESAVTLYLNMKTPLAKAQFALLGVVIAAAFEETIFRIFLFNAVRKWGGFWIGAIISSALFGLAHWQPGSIAQDVVLMVPLALGGFVLCTAYAKSGNAWVPIITHGIFNGVTLAVLFFAPQLAK